MSRACGTRPNVPAAPWGASRPGILSMDDRLRPFFDGVAEFYGAEQTPWGRFMSDMMIARHGPAHARLRGSAQAAFTPRNVNRHRELMRRVICELLDEWAPKGNFDFAEFASYFPITVFCGLLGVSPDVIPRIKDALETVPGTLASAARWCKSPCATAA